MQSFSKMFDRQTQDRLLACCDSEGVPTDLDQLDRIILECAPELAGPRYAEGVFDEVVMLWLDRQREPVTA
jgi:hypothetical protein